MTTNREHYKEMVIGRFYLRKRNEVGATDISEKELAAVEQTAMDCFDDFMRDQQSPIVTPFWMQKETQKDASL